MKSHLIKSEKSLFKKQYMSDIDYLNRIIDDDYEELGKSGKKFTKEDVIKELSAFDGDRPIDIYNFECEQLSENLWLVHYITLHKDRKIYRTSIWKKDNDALKILFHQASEYKDSAKLEKY